MPDTVHFTLFLSAAALLAISPGPGMLYVLARSLGGGRQQGIESALGTAVGGLVHVVAAGLGLSALLVRSASAFLVVKYLGAVYLMVLGLRTFWSAARDTTSEPPAARPATHPYWQGVLTEVLNPKTALFFLAFIPQFVDRAAPLIPQFLLLGAISVALNTTADFAVVLAAAPLQQRLRAHPHWRRRQERASGAVLIGLGGYVAISRSH